MVIGLRAMLAQLLALSLTFCAWHLQIWPFSGWSLLILQSGLALFGSMLLRLPVWWWLMQMLFVPLLIFCLRLGLPSYWYLSAFVLVWLVFRSNTRERVPLYLSNAVTCRALADLLDQRQAFLFLDLGCGAGTVLRQLGERHPQALFHGVESSPLLFLLCRWRLRNLTNCHVHFGSLWAMDLGQYDVVYCFLSPEPMPALWQKVQCEMPPASMLISNSFAVPKVMASEQLVLADRRVTQLYIYRF